MSQPIDLVKLAEQTLNDFKEFNGQNLEKEILVTVLYSVFQAGREHGLNHGWHEQQEKDNVDLGGC